MLKAVLLSVILLACAGVGRALSNRAQAARGIAG